MIPIDRKLKWKGRMLLTSIYGMGCICCVCDCMTWPALTHTRVKRVDRFCLGCRNAMGLCLCVPGRVLRNSAIHCAHRTYSRIVKGPSLTALCFDHAEFLTFCFHFPRPRCEHPPPPPHHTRLLLVRLIFSRVPHTIV